MKSIKEITLDINKKNRVTLTAKQGDINSRFIIFNLTDDYKQVDLTGKMVRVYADKIDGTVIFNDLTIVDAGAGKCELELTTQMLCYAGELPMELLIMEGESKLSTIPFMLNVIASINKEEAIVSTNEFSALVNALGEVQNIDNKFTAVNAQLDDITQHSAGLMAQITLADDDGNTIVWETLKPLLDSKGAVATICIPSNVVGDSTHMNATQLKSLEEQGWEIASHTKSHCNLSQLSLSEAEVELKDSKIALESMGLKIDTIVYPSGAPGDDEHKELAKKYYKIGVLAGQGNNSSKVASTPIHAHYLPRVPITTYMSQGEDNLQYFKTIIDDAISNKKWIILMSHVNSATAEHMQLLSDVIDYANSVKIPFVTVRDGFERFKNIIEGGKYSIGNKTEPYFVYSPNMRLYNNLGEIKGIVNEGDNLYYTNPPSYFDTGKVYYSYISSGVAQANGLPQRYAGILKIEKFRDFALKTYIIDSPYYPNIYTCGSNASNDTWDKFKRVNQNYPRTTSQLDTLPTEGLSSGDMFFNETLGMPVWRNRTNNGWIRLSETVDEVLSFSSGFSSGTIASQIRKNNKVVSLIISIKNDNGNFANGILTKVATLPIAFKPKSSIVTNCTFSTLEYDYDSTGYLNINSLGEIQVNAKVDNMKYAHINITYIVD